MENRPVEGAITSVLKREKGNYSKTHPIFFFFFDSCRKLYATIPENKTGPVPFGASNSNTMWLYKGVGHRFNGKVPPKATKNVVFIQTYDIMHLVILWLASCNYLFCNK